MDKGLQLLTARLDRLAAWAAAVRGRKAEIIRRFQEHRPQTNRQTIESWLHLNPARRRVPMADALLLLMDCARSLRIPAKIPPTNPQPETP